MRFPSRIALVFLIAGAASLPAQAPNSARKADPATEIWQRIKGNLQGSNGKDFFEDFMRDTLIPSGPDSPDSFPGKVVSSQPAEGPDQLILGFGNSTTPEITLRLRGRDGRPDHLTKPVAPGTRVAFQGIVTAFTREPFMLTIEIFPGGVGRLSILDAGR
jgi:hypothetical protein